jgi:2-phospho-L-lactate guanylyltransferase (CobY/MobA/RfbA family)
VLAKRAERLGVELAIVHDPLLALDVDRPEDVERVLDLGQGTRTHALLSRELDASAEFRRKSA